MEIKNLLSAIDEADDAYWEVSFFAVLFAYTALSITAAIDYGPDARLLPLLVGAPLAGLMVVKMILVLFADRFDVSAAGLSRELMEQVDASDRTEGTGRPKTERYAIQLQMVGWLAGLVALVWALGFLLALVLFVFLFVYYYEDNVYRAAATTLFAAIFVQLVFVVLLSANLWRGVLFG